MNSDILLLSEDGEERKDQQSGATPLPSKTGYDMALCVASFILSVILLVLFFSAANAVKTGGLEIMSIESVGGRTLEEAYYHGLGYVYDGYCAAIRAIGLFCSSILFLFGISKLKSLKQQYRR